MRATELGDYLADFRGRVVQDAMLNASATYWRRRADVWEDAAPKLTDFHGQASVEELRERWQRCTNAARACRRHADLLESEPGEVSSELRALLAEVAA